MSKPAVNNQFYSVITTILKDAREKVYRSINSTMVTTYWNIGKTIVEEEQRGKDKAEYGKYLLKYLSERLTEDFGKGFSRFNLENMRKFYLIYKNQHVTISETVSRKSQEPTFNLSWSHYVFLIRLDEAERKFYEIEKLRL